MLAAAAAVAAELRAAGVRVRVDDWPDYRPGFKFNGSELKGVPLRVESYDALIEYLRDAGGFAAAPWCGRTECETRVKADSSATIRCLPLDDAPAESDACICCGRPATAAAVWAQAY